MVKFYDHYGRKAMLFCDASDAYFRVNTNTAMELTMKIVVIGGTGLVGTGIVTQLRADAHNVIAVGRSGGDRQVDMTATAALRAMFEELGPVDAIISAAGDGTFGAFDAEDTTAYDMALDSKIRGQVNLTRIGHRLLTPGGSITLTSGAVTRHPMPQTAAIALGAGAIDAFVATVALELEQGKRINAVSLPMVKESAQAFGFDDSHCPSVQQVAHHYRDLALGTGTGQVSVPAA
jgi:NAD(P)-dependent dehydrogenase (short-subunit alcohol dehydrogenase family)